MGFQATIPRHGSPPDSPFRPTALPRRQTVTAGRRWIWLGAFLAPVLLAGCTRPEPPRGDAGKPAAFAWSGPVVRDRLADDTGRFLAGMPGREGSPFLPLESDDAWLAHRREFDAAWQRAESRWLPSMRRFQAAELAVAPLDGSVLFYPFSGPDALMPVVFFPRSPAYVMVGLEPAGTLPAAALLKDRQRAGRLSSIRAAMSSHLHRSFFITWEMDRDFRGRASDGLMTPILILLARTGHTVLGYRHIRLDEGGNITDRAPAAAAPRRNANNGIEIEFQSGAGAPVRKLFYFSINLSDPRLKDNAPFLRFLSRLNGMTTFLKATSYMPHLRTFSTIREQILTHSSAILQEDSGIPYRFFDASRWQVQLYGGYEMPYGSFRWLQQQDLRQAYATGKPKPLGFPISYGFARIQANLMLAIRKQPHT